MSVDSCAAVVLENGVRLAVDHMPDIGSVAVVVGVGVGGRHETAELGGISHFVEHMAFKGTPAMNVRQIAEFFDGLGAQYNAYTCKETTFFYFKVLAEHWERASLALLDMAFHSTYPLDEMEREKNVIIEEINESEDDPEDRASELYMACAYSGQQLGMPILGCRENIRLMTRDKLVSFVDSNYVGRNVVISVAGNVSEREVSRCLTEPLSRIRGGGRKKCDPTNYIGGDARETRDLEQVQIYLGFPSVGLTDDRYYACKLASVILGGGMSSRLFQEARERRGLAYSINSYSSGYMECGTFTIYASASPDKVNELIKVSMGQVVDMLSNISDDELVRAKNKIKSSILLGREDSMSRALWIANSHLAYDRYISVEETRTKIDELGADDIKKVIEVMLKSGKNTLTLLGKLNNIMHYNEFINICSAV